VDGNGVSSQQYSKHSADSEGVFSRRYSDRPADGEGATSWQADSKGFLCSQATEHVMQW